MAQATLTNHVTVDDLGVARIDGTRFKVVHLAAAVRGGVDSLRELRGRYPQLTVGQICSALAHYYDNQAAIDRQIDDELAAAIAARAVAGESPGRAKLRGLGLLP